ncbi:nitroreductase family protein [Amycolatopsis echigonensis]|uniref:NAD(P)H nitroreductase n=1 Tax=Amycolatopsis echigonensis TaxID=2576905 RepID=A0A8E1VUL3_9PSEU|nr:NAD(P)H nitroreductase [Amycolatopsis echigonensis]MBB2498568.1 NAD(P)H nitroreductase [Amycolatopsis echigonensis]
MPPSWPYPLPNSRGPSPADVEAAVAAALLAPGASDAPPWQWRVGYRTLHLCADPIRWGAADDPAGRWQTLSSGAALHHLRIAFAGLGWSCAVDRSPCPAEPGRLAVVTPQPGEPAPGEAALATSISRRREDLRPCGGRPVPSDCLDRLSQAAAREGAVLHPVEDRTVRRYLMTAIGARVPAQIRREEAYARSASLAAPQSVLVRAATATAGSRLPLSRGEAEPRSDGASLVVLSTPGDDHISWLRAGEALSSVLLTATVHGLSSGRLTRASRRLRETLAERVTLGRAPQAVLWVGRPSVGVKQLQMTRAQTSVDDVLEPLQAPAKHSR